MHMLDRKRHDRSPSFRRHRGSARYRDWFWAASFFVEAVR